MNVVTLDPGGYKLKPLEAIARLIRAPGFLANPNVTFAEYFVDKLIRASATNTSVNTDATLLISQAHMGVALFRQQRETSRLLAGFVYKTMIPDETVPTGMKFRRCYRITDQREAQHGTYDTVTNGVQSKEYSQEFKPTSRVVTMQFGCLLSVTVPSVAIDLIARELDRVSTSWELTRTIEVLHYCAAQPTLTDRIAQRTKTASRAERLDCVLTMAELMCGMVNVQPESFFCAMENARRVLESERPEVAIMGDSLFRVVSQKSTSGFRGSIVSEDAVLTPEFSVYTVTEERARSCGGGHEFTMREIGQRGLDEKGLPFSAGESAVLNDSSSAKVNYIVLGGGPGDRVPIVHVDGVQMEHGVNRDTSTEHKAFINTEGFKWEYFTVGCGAPALAQINPYHVLSSTDSDELNYKQLAQRSPSVSYLHRYDGAVASVTLRGLHPLGNGKELFKRARREKLQSDLNGLTRGAEGDAITSEKMVELAHSRDWYAKTNNPASLLEFDARNMVVPHRDPSAAPWLVRPRVALFNSSSMNSVENEMAQIGSELLALFGQGQRARDVAENLHFLDQALHHDRGLASMLEFRTGILRGSRDVKVDGADMAAKRLFWSKFADPVSAVGMRRKLADMEKEATGGLLPAQRTVLEKLESLINGVTLLFNGVVGERTNSLMAYMPRFYALRDEGDRVSDRGYPRDFTPEEVDYCNLMYWVVLPALGARVYREKEGDGQASEAATQHPISYLAHEPNLTNAFELSNAEVLTVARLNGNCVFSKVRPENFDEVTKFFEPTAWRTRCEDAGFHPTSVVTYMWAVRIQKLIPVANPLAKVLLGMHYSTLLTHEVVQAHYDAKYYSGMSYLMFRGLRFTGCGVALMQQKSALYTLGTGIICKPTSHNTHQVHTVNQYCESLVMPDTLESPGLYMPNLYMKDVRGGDVHVNTGGPFDMVIADAYNGFCPESDSASGYRRPYIFIAGRSERLGGTVSRDARMRTEGYTCMPTLLHPFSSVLATKPRKSSRYRNGEESNRKLFCETHHVAEFDKGLLDSIGDPFKDTVERACGNKRATDIMHRELGVAFCGTYGVGYTSDRKLMCASDETREALVDRLAPRISGTGLFACNPIATTFRLINPIFNRIFESSRYSRILQ